MPGPGQTFNNQMDLPAPQVCLLRAVWQKTPRQTSSLDACCATGGISNDKKALQNTTWHAGITQWRRRPGSQAQAIDRALASATPATVQIERAPPPPQGYNLHREFTSGVIPVHLPPFADYVLVRQHRTRLAHSIPLLPLPHRGLRHGLHV